MPTIEFTKLESTGQVSRQLADSINARLQTGSVLWLVSGGSAVAIGVAVSKLLSPPLLANLTVTLADERYGEPGHADSNWQQLVTAGFSVPGATVVPVLGGADLDGTLAAWQSHLEELFDTSQYRIALLGIGPDGHTSGILPGSVAVKTKELAIAYDGGDYQRLTTTPACLSKLDEAVVYATGESKRTALANLQNDLPVAEQPAQLLKTIPKVTIYNEFIGGHE